MGQKGGEMGTGRWSGDDAHVAGTGRRCVLYIDADGRGRLADGCCRGSRSITPCPACSFPLCVHDGRTGKEREQHNLPCKGEYYIAIRRDRESESTLCSRIGCMRMMANCCRHRLRIFLYRHFFTGTAGQSFLFLLLTFAAWIYFAAAKSIVF